MSIAAHNPPRGETLTTASAPSTATPDEHVAARGHALLVCVSELAERFGTVRIIDTRSSKDCARGVIPGSVHLPLAGIAFDDTSAHAIEQLATAVRQALQQRGISADEHLVFVDDTDGSAAVGLVLAELAGCRASVLSGGIGSWTNAGLELAQECAVPSPVEQWHPHPQDAQPSHVIAPCEDVRNAHHAGHTLIDTRAQLEHEGIVGGLGRPKGHIPGSVHLEWSGLYRLTGEIAVAGQIRAMMGAIGVGIEDPCIVYCNAAHRAAAAAIILRHAGFTGVRVYLGGWHEWTRRELPVAPTEDLVD